VWGAEEPLPAGGSCLLGSLNLSAFVNNGDFDYDSLAEAVFTATVALNEVLDEGLMLHPLQEQQQSVGDWRQIGLGVFGIADMLIKMEIRYGSEESIELCRGLSNFILNYSMLASSTLAMEKGTYKYYNYKCVSETEFYKTNTWETTDKAIKQYGLRNSQLLTIAPTGSISTMLGVSGGVEPIFANYYERKTQSLHGEDVFYKVYTPIVKEYMETHEIQDDKELPTFFITSQQIPPMERIEFQAAWQSAIDASISSTINLPEETTIEDIEQIYLEAWRHKLKGVTIFRDNCKRAGVLVTSHEEKEKKKQEPSITPTQPQRGEVITVSDDLIGKKRKVVTGCGSLHIMAYFDPYSGELREVYLSKGSEGGCASFMNGLSRMISIAARAGVAIGDITDQLNSCVTCPSYAVRKATKHDTSKGNCCPAAVAYALKDMYQEVIEEIRNDEYEVPTTEAVVASPEKVTPAPVPSTVITKCPECGEPVEHIGGCVSCPSCGWSKCG
jgi:ribonucleoside-diphosphate reductase alpha chain